MAPRHRHSGMWKPGQSGNPNGRPKSNFTNYLVKDLAKMYTADAIQKLFDIATSRMASPSVQLRATEVILNIGWGKIR